MIFFGDFATAKAVRKHCIVSEPKYNHPLFFVPQIQFLPVGSVFALAPAWLGE